MLWLWTVFSVATTFVIFAWVTFRIYYRDVLRMCTNIPTAQPYLPLLGNTLMFTCSQEKLTNNLLKSLEGSVLKGQRAVCLWLCGYPFVVVTDPDDIKKVLNNSLSRGKEFEESGTDIMKYGLLTSPVDHWKVTRRHLNLSFNPRNLQQLIPTFNQTSKKLVVGLLQHLDGATFDIYPNVMTTALRTIGIFLYGMGTDGLGYVSDNQIEENKLLVELVEEIMALRMFHPWFRNKIIFQLLFRKELKFIRSFLHLFPYLCDNTYGKSPVHQENESNNGFGSIQVGFQTILGAMRELQKKDSSIKEKHVMDEMLSFFGAGTDTMAASISSCLIALARLPDVQEKVYEEICSVVTDDDVVYQDLIKLKYLDQVIKETLRFLPVVPFTTRDPTRDIDLGGYTIPRNKTTFLYLSSVNFNPKYFPNPHTFDPDRFSTAKSSHDGVFTPFSRGSRNCIGKEYAMMLMKVMIVHVVRKFRLSTNLDIQNLRKKFILAMTCCDGYNVSLTERGK